MSELPAESLYTDAQTGHLCARRYRLTVRCGPDAGRGMLLEEGTVLIGKSPDCDLCLSDRSVSRHHLELQVRPDGIHVIDAGSTNGMLLVSDKDPGAPGVRVGTAVLTGAARLRLGPNTEIELLPAELPVEVPEYTAEQFGGAIGRSRSMRELFGLLSRAARSEATV